MQPRPLGRYVLLEHLASGATGEVFVARGGAPGLHRRFAVKTIHASLARDVHSFARWRQAAAGALGLSHPQLVTPLEIDRCDGRWFVATELVEGGDLARLMAACRRRRQPLAIPAVLHLGVQLLSGLAHCHRRAPQLALDVSPVNVLLSLDGAVRFTDCGLGLAATGQSGRPGYAAPERLRGEPPSAAADLFSVAVILWELLTCERYAEGRDVEQVTSCYARRLAAPISSIRAAIPPRVDRLFERALAIDPEARSARADELASEAQRALVDLDPSVGPWDLATFARSMLDAPASRRAGRAPLQQPPATSRPVATSAFAGLARSRPRPRQVVSPPEPESGAGAVRPAVVRLASFAEELCAPTVVAASGSSSRPRPQRTLGGPPAAPLLGPGPSSVYRLGPDGAIQHVRLIRGGQ